MDTAESADIAVRVWPGKYSIDDVTTPNGKTFRLINLPFYYVGMIDKILDKATEPRLPHEDQLQLGIAHPRCHL